ncbi:AsmA family protein [Pseudomonas sp. MAP12]|uniref:AsmA family protein n=1 Tax=Geopseudomonas aromaticivorans TaxID=2849492 RepID=A0ABS6MX71_9GAMM|nr:AsmA family protein [Pseudomonas aromaticivorans]MBV2133409.1 AsmA family protein [Pseudomonas aromaticivorans]
MKAFGKFLGLLLLGLLLILVALGFALTQLLDPNDYKDEIRQLARDKANLELNLAGEIGWSLFPWLGLEIHDATLASASTPQQPFADLKMLGFSVRVLPLLSREVQMSDIRIDGLDLKLQRDAQGHGNWQDIGRLAGQPQQATPPAAGSAPSAGTPTPAPSVAALKLDIDSLAVSNTRIVYHDAGSGRQYSIEGLDLRSGPIREGASIPLILKGLASSNQPQLQATSELVGNLRFDTALQRYLLEDVVLKGEASGAPLGSKTLAFSAQGQLLVDLVAQVAEWNSLKLSANQLHVLGELKVRELDKQPQLEGGLSIAEFDLRAFLESIDQSLPPMADANTLRRATLVAGLSASPTSLTLQDLKLTLDDSSFSGQLAVADFSRQSLRAQLKGDRLDLDRYLPPPSEAAEAASASRKAEVQKSAQGSGVGNTPLPDKPTTHAWSEAPLLPLPALRRLDAELTVNLGQLTLRKLPIDNARLKVKAQNGQLDLGELRGDLFDGNFAVSGSLDARSDTPQLQFAPKLDNIPLERLLHTLKPAEKPPLRGNLQLDASLNARGNSEKALIDSLAGKASFVLDDGALADANLEQQLCRGIATLNRKTLSSEFADKDTPLQELRGSLQVKNGVASNQDLRARIPGLTVNGKGDIDLRVLGLDYRLGLTIGGDQRATPDPACQVNERYAGLEWPLRCRGPLELGAKACRLDQDGLGKIAAKMAGEKLSEKLNEKLDEKLGDKVDPELKDALKNLFKR